VAIVIHRVSDKHTQCKFWSNQKICSDFRKCKVRNEWHLRFPDSTANYYVFQIPLQIVSYLSDSPTNWFTFSDCYNLRYIFLTPLQIDYFFLTPLSIDSFHSDAAIHIFLTPLLIDSRLSASVTNWFTYILIHIFLTPSATNWVISFWLRYKLSHIFLTPLQIDSYLSNSATNWFISS
jgi:hypothetical protein